MAEEGKDGAWETAPEPEDIAGGYRGGGGECVGEEQFILQGERAGGGGEGSGWGVGGCEAEDECVVARGVRGMSGTPETDDIARGNHVVPVEWAEQLERERDEAREKTERYRLEANAIMMQRDEAREKVEQQRKEIVRLNGATNHAGGTPLKIALKERDDAREEVRLLKGILDVIKKEAQ